MSSDNLFSIKEVCVNVSIRQKRGAYIPSNIIEKVNGYSKLLLTTEYFVQAFDKDTGFAIKNLILYYINKSMSI